MCDGSSNGNLLNVLLGIVPDTLQLVEREVRRGARVRPFDQYYVRDDARSAEIQGCQRRINADMVRLSLAWMYVSTSTEYRGTAQLACTTTGKASSA